jgi:hypothetical protein
MNPFLIIASLRKILIILIINFNNAIIKTIHLLLYNEKICIEHKFIIFLLSVMAPNADE